MSASDDTPKDAREEEIARSASDSPGAASAEDDALAELVGDEGVSLGSSGPAKRNLVANFITRFTSVSVPRSNPLHQRITSEHIGQIIDKSERDSERAHTSEASERRYRFLYFLIGLVAAIALLVFFSVTNEREMLTNVLIALLGFAGGFGLGRTTRRR